jgi:hypothetical protein
MSRKKYKISKARLSVPPMPILASGAIIAAADAILNPWIPV